MKDALLWCSLSTLIYIISQYGKNANVFFKNILKNVRISQDIDGKVLVYTIFCMIYVEDRIGIRRFYFRSRGETSMDKNRILPIKVGSKGMRMSYSRQKEVLEMPNLIEVQKNSYQWFLEEGLGEAFRDISPITDYSGKLSLAFTGFQLCEEDAKYTIEQCKERDATYAAPLKVKVRLHNRENDEINEHDIFMGDLPLMTETGTFVINGAERVIVSQLVRSPGIYYTIGHDKIGKTLYSCTVIPNRGAWLDFLCACGPQPQGADHGAFARPWYRDERADQGHVRRGA